MAERKGRTGSVLVNVDEHGDKKIVRDSTFSRAVVDEILPIPLSKDVELSCLQVSPLIHGKKDLGDMFSPELEEVFVEVARIRVGYPESVNLAMLILHMGIRQDRVRGDKIVETILQWTREGAETKNDVEEQ